MRYQSWPLGVHFRCAELSCEVLFHIGDPFDEATDSVAYYFEALTDTRQPRRYYREQSYVDHDADYAQKRR